MVRLHYSKRMLGSWLVTVLLLVGCGRTDVTPKTESAILLQEPRELPLVKLQSDNGEWSSEQVLQGRWTILFFGYTRCPDVCPTELYLLGQLLRELESGSHESVNLPQILFISVDPDRDTPAAVAEYAHYYHPQLIGVTGEQEQVDRLVEGVGAVYERAWFSDGRPIPAGEVDPDGDDYLINHSATSFLINPDGELHALLPSPQQVEVMIRDLAAMQQAY